MHSLLTEFRAKAIDCVIKVNGILGQVRIDLTLPQSEFFNSGDHSYSA